MRKLSATILILALLAGAICLPGAAAAKETPVLLDGTALNTKALVDGTTVYLPFRAVCEALGYTVTWDNSGGIITASASRPGDSVAIDVTNMKMRHNDHLFNALVFSGNGILLESGHMYVESGLFSSVFPIGSSYDAKTDQITLQRRLENNITIVNETVTSQKDFLKTTIQYPVISGLHDAAAQSAINAAFKQAAQNAQDEGEKNAADMAQAVKDGYTGAVDQCETYFDYMIQYNQNGLLSAVLQDYQYAGGAHGTTIQTSYTFDLSTGKELKLSDLMNGHTAYAAFINASIRREIDRRVAAGDLSEFDFSPFKDIGPDPSFYLSDSGIVFYFQEYEYFPYAAGIQEFNVKFSDLCPMIDNAFRFLCETPITLRSGVNNALSVGEIGRVTLNSNPTTGFVWHYSISDSSVLAPVSENYNPPGGPGVVGAGGTSVWNFKAINAGQATITFKYYRDWEGESSATAENTVIFKVTVSLGTVSPGTVS